MATALPCLGFALPAATHRFDFRYSRTGMVTTTTDADRAVAPAAARRHPRPAPSARSEVLPYPAATGVVAAHRHWRTQVRESTHDRHSDLQGRRAPRRRTGRLLPAPTARTVGTHDRACLRIPPRPVPWRHTGTVVPMCEGQAMTGTVTCRADAHRFAEPVACCRHPQPARLVVHPAASDRDRRRRRSPALLYPCARVNP